MTRALAIAVIMALAAGSAARAADPPPPENEWWKRAKPPKRHGPVTWSVGALVGFQDWVGLEDSSASASQRAAGWTGTFDTTSPIYGVIGSIEAKRFGTIGVGVDMFIDGYSNGMSETAYPPPPNSTGMPSVNLTLNVWRLGAAGRAIFRSASRVQPTASLGLAWAHTTINDVFHFPSSGVTQGGASSTTSLDVLASGGIDVALQSDVRRGWRTRVELGVELRGFNQTLLSYNDGPPGPLAYKAQLGFIYRFEPATVTAKPAVQ
jgi:opacity protein-like surface antigen